MHIGLIGGIGPAATIFYYRGLAARHAIAGSVLDLTIANADVRQLASNVANGNTRKQAEIFANLTERLAAAGAKAVGVTSMAGHFCIDEFKAISPLPIIDARPSIGAAIRTRNLKRVGVIGTRAVMDSKFYGAIESAEIVVPQGAAFDQVHCSYIEMASTGRVSDEKRELFFSAGRDLCRKQGAEAVLLGGTDLFLAFHGRDPGYPVIDCAEIHIEALYEKTLPQSL